MSSLEQLYQQVILDHSRRRSGFGPIAGLEYTSHQVNPTCGDEVTLGVKVGPDGQLDEVHWEGDGCSISQASLSMMTEMVEGADLDRLRQLYHAMDTMMHSRGQGVDEELLDELEDAAALEGTSKFANRIKCSLLGWSALRDALAQAGYDIAITEEDSTDE
ncbi:Fe-S cluster assembly sulfur transfer protein SufU [Scrofimicrobium sp. R131]|uniref:SUF system NifU family Fe-S cluster assembly protein n=1 Tax=Scrofimicrobium appendicitidis TaxID=3079930 RepID=A0AAU7V9B9_9ACTO